LSRPCGLKENNESPTMAKKIVILVVNWQFRASVKVRQTKILTMKKEK
jgi:hypothetical protein